MPLKVYLISVLAIFFCLLSPVMGWAQEPAGKTQLPALPDTTRQNNPDRLLRGLEEYSKRKSLPAKAVKALFNFKKKKPADLLSDPELINYEFSQHDYKIVRNIEIINLDPFGFSINDSTARPRNVLQRAGNSVHIKTQKGRIRNKLLFRKGKQLQPQALIESER